MPPGPRLTTLPVLGNIFSLDLKAEKFSNTSYVCIRPDTVIGPLSNKICK